MSVVLLRTLTRKSIIGWGTYRDLTVQNLLDMNKHHELLNIYYTCRNIDFMQDVKDELCIHGEREINKKEKTDDRYIKGFGFLIHKCLEEIDSKKTANKKIQDIHMGFKEKRKKLKDSKLKFELQKRGLYSKGSMKYNNQKNK